MNSLQIAHHIKKFIPGKPRRQSDFARNITYFFQNFIVLFESILPENPGFALVGSGKSHKVSYRRGLSRTVRSQKAEYFAFIDVKIDVENASARTVILGEIFNFDNSHLYLLSGFRIFRIFGYAFKSDRSSPEIIT